MQNVQPMRQPACDDTHSVARSLSGMKTASTSRPPAPSKRYFTVPSLLRASALGAVSPTVYFSLSRSRPAFDRSVISSIEVTRRSYSHAAICLAAKGLSPASAATSRSSGRVRPMSGLRFCSSITLNFHKNNTISPKNRTTSGKSAKQDDRIGSLPRLRPLLSFLQLPGHCGTFAGP